MNKAIAAMLGLVLLLAGCGGDKPIPVTHTQNELGVPNVVITPPGTDVGNSAQDVGEIRKNIIQSTDKINQSIMFIQKKIPDNLMPTIADQFAAIFTETGKEAQMANQLANVERDLKNTQTNLGNTTKELDDLKTKYTADLNAKDVKYTADMADKDKAHSDVLAAKDKKYATDMKQRDDRIADLESEGTKERNAKLNLFICLGIILSVGGVIVLGVSSQYPIPIIGKAGGSIFGAGVLMSSLALFYLTASKYLDQMQKPFIIGSCILGSMILIFIGWVLFGYCKATYESVATVQELKPLALADGTTVKDKLQLIGLKNQSDNTISIVGKITNWLHNNELKAQKKQLDALMKK